MSPSAVLNDNKVTISLGPPGMVGMAGVYLNLDGQFDELIKEGTSVQIGGGKTRSLTTEAVTNPPAKTEYQYLGIGDIDFTPGADLVVSRQLPIKGDSEQEGEDILYLYEENSGRETDKFVAFKRV